MPSSSIENYLKTIYAIETAGEKPTTSRIAAQMDITMGSVTGKLKQLAADGYLRHRPYYGVRLTEKGRRLALNTLRHHRLIELFLVETLGLSWDEVHADAEVLEHAVSHKLIERIYEFLGRPEFDPHGSPIPRKDGTVRKLSGRRLAELKDGAAAEVLHVSDADGAFLRYLSSIGLAVGTSFVLERREPYGGPLYLRVAEGTLTIGSEAAERILVKPASASRRRRSVG